MLGYLGLAIIFVAFLTGSIAYNLIVKRLRDQHPNDWAKTGYPRSWFDLTLPKHLIHSTISGHRFPIFLIFRTPSWVNKDSYAKLLLIIYRMSSALFFGLMFGIPLIALLLS
ncbi:MAG: hypothetical protein WBO10_12260 [Pyrinomonadaceae bacterium]